MATANQNFGKLGNTYSGIRAHAERTFKKHENENIDKTMSQFNQYGHMNKSGNLVPGIQKSNDVSKPMYRKLAEDYLRKTVNEHNKKVHSKTREWKLSDKINENKDKINRELLITIGNKATNEKQFDNFKNSLKNIAEHYGKSDVIEKGLKQSGKTYDEWVTGVWKRTMSKTLVDFVKEYNERHTALKITDYATNVDEDGAPHVHCRLITLGESVGGRRNFSLNGALYRESKDTDSRAVKITKTKDGKEKKTISSRYLMKKYRRNEDTRLINHVNRELKKTVNDFTTKILGVSEKEIKNNPYDDCYTVDFGKLERTGENGGRSMEEYKQFQQLKKEKKEAEKAKEKAEKENKELKDDLKTLKHSFRPLNDYSCYVMHAIPALNNARMKGYSDKEIVNALAKDERFQGVDNWWIEKELEGAEKLYNAFSKEPDKYPTLKKIGEYSGNGYYLKNRYGADVCFHGALEVQRLADENNVHISKRSSKEHRAELAMMNSLERIVEKQSIIDKQEEENSYQPVQQPQQRVVHKHVDEEPQEDDRGSWGDEAMRNLEYGPGGGPML